MKLHSAVLGFIVLAALVLGVLIGGIWEVPHDERQPHGAFEHWLNRYQTLIAGCIAFIGAALTIKAMGRQSYYQRRAVYDSFARELSALRAMDREVGELMTADFELRYLNDGEKLFRSVMSRSTGLGGIISVAADRLANSVQQIGNLEEDDNWCAYFGNKNAEQLYSDLSQIQILCVSRIAEIEALNPDRAPQPELASAGSCLYRQHPAPCKLVRP